MTIEQAQNLQFDNEQNIHMSSNPRARHNNAN